MGYECFVFAWDDINGPLGGCEDLQGCFDTLFEAELRAKELEKDYDHVQIMDKDGERKY